MGIKQIFHPQEISRRHVLYRAWRLMHENRLWEVRVPAKQHICLWFWPALFATVVFLPLYPALVTLRFVVRYTLWIPLITVGNALFALLGGVIGKIAALTGPILRVRVGNRMTVGSLFLMALTLSLCATPHVNRWFTGIALTVFVSYLAVDFFFRTVSAFAHTVKKVVNVASSQWYAAPLNSAAQYRLAFVASVLITLLAAPFVWFSGFALIAALTIGVSAAILAVAILIAAGIESVRAARTRRSRMTAFTGPSRAITPPKTKRMGVLPAYLSAIVNGVCPEVRFVD